MTQRFDQQAATWDENPRRVRLAKAVGQAIAQRVPLNGAMSVLDFGCGTGLLTLKLQPLVGSITGADLSKGMLDVFERKVQEQGFENVHRLDLDPASPFDWKGPYDLVTSSMALHHVQDVPGLLKHICGHLKPGGFVALADLDREDGTFHEGPAEDVFHLGFDRRILAGWMEEAGLEEGVVETAYEIRRNGRDYPVFLATARKP